MQASLVATINHQETKLKIRDLLLYALTFSSGAVDAISFLSLGGVFSAFMTGNIVFLGLRLVGADTPGAVAIAISLAAFASGAYVAAKIVKPASVSGLWSQRVTIALGGSLVAHAVFLIIWFAAKGQPSIDIASVLLGSWGFAMGMQSAAVRTLHLEGVYTNVMTSTIVILAGHVANRSATVPERWRLAGMLAALFVGVIAGGLLLVHCHLYAPVLPFVISLAVVATAAMVLREPSRK